MVKGLPPGQPFSVKSRCNLSSSQQAPIIKGRSSVRPPGAWRVPPLPEVMD
jgi:hypothetical protein